MLDKVLLEKYDVEVPRYTSYPTVPYWQKTPISQKEWQARLQNARAELGINSVPEIGAKAISHRENSRGGISLYIHLPYCESLCTFCACNKHITKNHQVEQPYIDALLQEWRMYKQILGTDLTIKELHLGGGTPTFFAPASLEHLLTEIFRETPPAEQPIFSFEAHPNSTSQAHLELFSNFGFTRMSLGVQDISERINFIINRQQTVAEIVRATEQARNLGYTSINFDLIYGLPGQGEAEMRANLDFLEKMRPERIALYSFAFVPWVKKSGQRKFSEEDLPDKLSKRKLYEIAKLRLLQLGYVEIGMDHFALPEDSLARSLLSGNLHRNFMGYTPVYSRLLIGLGASAISDIWHSFMQNIVDIKGYLQSVGKGEFPIHRGHILSAEDLQVRPHILNIMCRFSSDFSQDQALWHEIYPRLQPLQKDGLWELINDYQLRVTERGKPFLRNICQALDLRYWQAKPEQPLFSRSI